jgi:hypothetical protein
VSGVLDKISHMFDIYIFFLIQESTSTREEPVTLVVKQCILPFLAGLAQQAHIFLGLKTFDPLFFLKKNQDGGLLAWMISF